MAIVFRLPYLLHPPTITYSEYQWGWKWLYAGITNIFGDSPRIFVTLGLINTLLQAIFVNRLTTQFSLFKKDTFFPAGIFIMITAMIPDWSTINAISLAAWGLIYLLFTSMELSTTTLRNKLLFNQGMAVGMSMMIHYPMILMLMFVWWSLAIVHIGKIKYFLLPLVGAIVVPYFIMSFRYLLDYDSLMLSYDLVFEIFIPDFKDRNDLIILGVVILLMLGGSFIYLNRIFDKEIILTKNRWNMIFIILIITIFIGWFRVSNETATWYLLVIPTALMASSIFVTEQNKWILRISFYLLMGIVLFLQYQSYIFKI